jgi:hypothetical protein
LILINASKKQGVYLVYRNKYLRLSQFKGSVMGTGKKKTEEQRTTIDTNK